MLVANGVEQQGDAAAGQKLFPIQTAWGEIRRGNNQLELHIDQLPDDRTVSIPRLNNPIGAVYLKAEPQKRPLQLKPGTTDWQITLPKTSTAAISVVVVETKGPVYVPLRPRVVSPAHDGSITLHAHDAVTHGKLLRYEPQPHKNTIGYWARAEDWCQWHLRIEQPGQFDVHVLQGCGKGQGGSQVAITIADQTVHFTVEDTGHFQNFKERKLGSIKIPAAGNYTLKLKPIKKAAQAVMDVRQVRLVPSGG
ncbi:MAG: hypothetical protein OES79_13120 [Planctomycetota bacterium]|nr:hypothetical protein [Planctomycetota bacterium]